MNSEIVSISCDLIDPPDKARKLNPQKVEALAKSIENNGLLQSPGVIANGKRYRVVYGFHRVKAIESLGWPELPVRLLAPDMTKAAELTISIQENHVRAAEDFEDTLARIEFVAQEKGCTIAQASKDLGVSSSYASKARRIINELSADAQALAKEKRVGISVLYPISKAPPEQRDQLLKGYLDGSLTRDQVVGASKTKRVASSKNISFTVVSAKIKAKLTLDSQSTYGDIFEFLNLVKRAFSQQQKNKIPVRVLPEVVKEVTHV